MKKTLILITSLSLTNFQAQKGKFLDFNGIDRYMKIPHHRDFNFSNEQEFTISFWINANSYKNNRRIISKRPAYSFPSDLSGYEIIGTNSYSKFYGINTHNPSGKNVFSQWSNSQIELGKWTHISFVVSRKNGKTYIYQYLNGEISQYNQQPIDLYEVTNKNDILIGLRERSKDFLDAKLDNLRFYNKALSQTEIIADMSNNEIDNKTPNLIAGYDFENIKNDIVSDITGKHNASLYNFPPEKISITQISNYTGKGNEAEEILKITYNNQEDKAKINHIILSTLGTTNLSDIEKIRIYNTGKSNHFDYRNIADYQLIGEAKPKKNDIKIKIKSTLEKGINYLWVTYHISQNSKEGNKVDASLKSITINHKNIDTDSIGNPNGNREILLKRRLVFAPGDYSSKNYRIPAIITANDGSIVVLNDKRKEHPNDLPANIDVVTKRSTDGGFTWSSPTTIMEGDSTFGYGDPVIFKTLSGKLITLFVGGVGFWKSTNLNPMRMYSSESKDNGITWSPTKDITPQIYGFETTDPIRKQWLGAFFSSGQGLTLSNGRIMIPIVVRKDNSKIFDNYIVYSDDEGISWKVSQKAISKGDEAKIVELNNGNILLSSRAWNRKYSISTDKGETWSSEKSWKELYGDPTNGDMIRYTSTQKGDDKNRLIHSIPHYKNRSNVTLFLSYDEGISWEAQKIISPGPSAYSSICILPDGSIGVYVEEDDSKPYKLYFLNFSLDWLTNGKDNYSPNKK